MIKAAVLRSLKLVLVVSLFCSLLVSAAAILLNPLQQANLQQYMVENILVAAGLYQQGMSSEAIYQRRIEPILIELSTGNRVDAAFIAPDFSLKQFDIKSFTDDPKLSIAIPAERDIAKIDRRPKYMLVYLAKTKDEPDMLILPVYGKGLWSTLYGLLALKRDLRSVEGITFYQHGETPGLGGEIENPDWQAKWHGKQVLDADGRVIIKVVKAPVDPEAGDAFRQVDGLAGATLTSKGVEHLLHYWLGDDGYGPFLDKLRHTWAANSAARRG